MSDDFTQMALTALPCKLAWFLVQQDQFLITQSIAAEAGAAAARTFLQVLQPHWPQGYFPLRRDDNPLAEILLSNTPLVNLYADQLNTLPGGAPFALALRQLGLEFVNLFPLTGSQEHLRGVLVTAVADERILDTEQARVLTKLLCQQASLELDKWGLQAMLAASEAQLESERRFRQLVLNTMGDGLIIVNQQAEVSYASQRLLLMAGYSREELAGKPVGDLFSEKSRAVLMQALLSGHSKTFPFAQELLTKSGQVVPVLMSRVVAQDVVGKGISTIIMLSDLTEIYRREEALEQQTQRLEALNRASRALGSALSLPEVIQIILSAAQEVAQGVAASILLKDIDNPDELICVATIGSGAEHRHGQRIRFGEGIAGWVAVEAQSQVVSEVSQDPRFYLETKRDPALEINSIAAVPLLAANEVIGVLEVVNRQSDAFDTEDLSILEGLGASAAVAIEKASLFDETQRRLTELGILLDASAAVSGTLDIGVILEYILRRLRDALDVQRVVITTWNSQRDTLSARAEVVDGDWSAQNGPLVPFALAPLKAAAVSQKRPLTADLGQRDLARGDRDDLEARGMRSVVNIPWYFQGQVVGLVALYSESSTPPSGTIHSTAVLDAMIAWEQMERPWENLTALCRLVLQASGVRWCSLYLLEQSNAFRLVREVGSASWVEGRGPLWGLHRFPIMRSVIRTGEAQMVVVDALEDDPAEQAYLQRIGAGNSLIAPLVMQGKVTGILRLATGEKRPFDHSEFSLCQGVATVVGNALENVWLYSSLEHRANALESAYRELEGTDRLKDELLQNLSHELSTPLTHILGYMSLLREGDFGPLKPEQASTVQLVIQKAQRVADLIKDMVAAHSSSTGKLNLVSAPLEQVAALAERSLSSKAQAANIRLVSRIQPNLPPALIDQAKIGEVFEALLDNAIKFSGSGTQIEISIEDTGGPMLRVSVKDQGIGISPEEHTKIFGRFYQVDGSTTRQYGGTGLGLAIVSNVIQSHGGKVWVESELGRGACFYFTVPKASFG